MNFSINKDEILLGARTSLVNTRQQRFQNIQYTAELKDDQYIFTSEQGKLKLDIYDEIALYTILKFRFAPLWLIRQYYQDFRSGIYIGEDRSNDKIKDFIDFGLLFEFPSAVCNFLMPTNRLASLFDMKLGGFNDPPYNTLTHTISEQKVMLDCMSGKAKYLEDIPHVPFVSNLGLGKLEKGTTIIPESDYTLRSSFIKKNLELLNDQEASLIREILEGKLITTVDLKEFQLVIHKKVSDKEFDFKVPDLSILCPRKLDEDGVAIPQSTALEVELTGKGQKAYERLLDLYWDNLRFGRVIYLTNNNKIKEDLIKAVEVLFDRHEKDGIEQVCQFQIEEFEIPYNKRELETIGKYED